MRLTRSFSNWPGFVQFALVAFVATASCQKTKTTADAERPIDVCALISREDVQSIQGSTIKEVKSSENTNGGFHTSDCSYTGESNDQSVTLSLVQKNTSSPKAIDPKAYWKTSFSRYSDETKEIGAQTEKEEKSEGEQEIEVRPTNVRPPKRIEGLGDAAFWMTNFTGGGLYVLKGDIFIRVTVNGPESEESRIEKSKALAAKALSKL